MAPRASWKGQLKLSLVSLPVRLYNAITSTAKISLNQLHAECNRRLRQQMVCPEHGAVDRSEIARGYEYEKGKYVVIDDADLEHVKLETNRTIELTQFIETDELDQLYLNAPYFVAPDGPVAEEAFRVIREALKRTGKIGIGRVVLSGRENIVALEPRDRGFTLSTLRYADEVRSAEPYFDEIRNGDVDDEQIQLATQLIENKSAPFDPSQFEDRYKDALLDVIKAKVEGSEPVVVQEEEVGKVINLMDALRESLKDAPEKKPPAKSVKTKKAAKPKKAKRA